MYAWHTDFSNGSAPFEGYFKNTLDKYPCVDKSVENIRHIGNLFDRFKGVFAQACQDFTSLMRIDYRTSFYCSHQKYVTDAVAFGPKKERCRLDRPWNANDKSNINTGDPLIILVIGVLLFILILLIIIIIMNLPNKAQSFKNEYICPSRRQENISKNI